MNEVTGTLPLKPCVVCDDYAHRIALARPPLYREQRTELATALMVHRATARPHCPNWANDLVPVATYDSVAVPCPDCVSILLMLHRCEGDLERAATDDERGAALESLAVAQRDRTEHRTPERCPSVVAALSTQAAGA